MRKKGNRKADAVQVLERLGKQQKRSAAKKREPVTGFAFEGRVQGSGRGFAFLIRDGIDRDLFVPAHNLHGALHGDRVIARQVQAGTATRGGVAEVQKIVARGVTQFVGKIIAGGAYSYAVPDDARLAARFDVLNADLNGAVPGDKVVAKITDYGGDGDDPSAAVIEVLGDADTVGVDVLSVIRSYGLYEEFEKPVLDEAHAAPASVTEAELVGREDFRNDLVITIDGEDAKDLDDAVRVERIERGYRLFVHIADVSHYVLLGSALDKEAFKRGTSVYFPDRVLPMLPQELSNGICSLNEGVDRLTTSCVMDFDDRGERTNMRVVKGVIRSTHRMTYTAVQAILDGDKAAREEYPDLIAMLEDMRELTGLLLAKRQKRGAVDFAAVEEPKIVLDKHTGKIISLTAYPRKLSNRMIEEFMLAANEAIAHRFRKLGVPFVYRIHETPAPEKIEALRAFAAPFGLTLHAKEDKVTPSDVQKFLNDAHGKACERVVNQVALRAMQKAKYLETCSGHFGLAAEDYCHFTSPIRRYPDLSIHRIIGDYLTGGKEAVAKYREFAVVSAQQSSDRELIAQEAEREVDDLKKAEYMHDHLGEDFEGTISGVTAFGLFVELDNTVEGLLRIESLPDKSYECDEVHYVLKGSTRTYRLGDRLTVRCAAASKETRKVEFCLPDTAVSRAGEPEIKKMQMPAGDSKQRAKKRR